MGWQFWFGAILLVGGWLAGVITALAFAMVKLGEDEEEL